jgi:hypothetical protein
MGTDTLQVNDVTPTWGYLKGNQKVVITGCGFTTYSEATCVWGNWHSTNALIVDDNTIHCWTPKVSFVTVPTTTSFQIIFDGTPAIFRKLPEFWWGPMITTITPTQMYVAGGSLTINGFGFSEWSAATTNVTIDGAACTGVSITDTAITCNAPAGSINQNAIVDVYFNGNKYYFAHTYPNTLHYGPILSSINPTCGHVKGGDTITITGSLFDDPVLNNPRVEFFINGGWWWGSNAVHTGSVITVQTPVPANGFDAWDQNVPLTVFGGSPSFAKVPGSASFHYGALMFTVTPTVGYIDGGETVSITGCAFRDYNNTQVQGIFLNSPANTLCNTNTVNIVSDTLMTCTSVSSTTCFQSGLNVNVAFTDSRQLPAGSQTAVQNQWWWGPKLTVTSLTPSRGPINFVNPVTVTGYKIGRSTNTLFALNEATFTAPAVTVNATVGNGQTTMTFTAPVYIWQGTSTVSYRWETCGTYPEVTPVYKWGPSCSSITPTFGYVGGQQSVTLGGVGFQDQDWNGKVLRARFCTPSAGCNWEQLGFSNVTVTSGSTATVSTPNFALAPRNGLGANRYFGDNAAVTLFFDTNGVNETQSLSCGSYRYGPIVTGLNPRKGPIGPRADHSPNTAVTIIGAGFQDPLLTNNIRVAFGNIHGEAAATTSDTTITVKTLWGARANTDKSVYVYFDTCNTTSSTASFSWGPQVYNVTPIWGYNAGTNGTNTVITIQGARFGEWNYAGYTDAICVIDNVYGTNTQIVDDNTITCTVPARPFGTQAVVQVLFGKTCRGEWDWSQAVQSPRDIYYKPIITSITPTAGYTSGNQAVTISGMGLGNWPNYYCWFGHYKGVVTSQPSGIDGSVVCSTPQRREDFNTDVLVHVQLVADDTIPPASAGFDFKVWGPTYHYGPICSGVSPSRGYFNHDPSYQITLSGLGFSDAQWFNQTQPYVLVDGLNVTIVSANDGQVVVSGLTNANSCQQNRTITMWWDKQTQVITCPVYTHGPVVVSSTPDLGWAGDTVTVMGDFLDDPVIYNQLTNVQVTFGSATGTTLSVNQNQITVTAPVNAWLFDAPVSVAWSGYNRSCTALRATNFHYGPIITAINPTFGYVWGRIPVTVTGRGFTCCGLPAGTTNCRFAHTEITQDTTTVNSDTTITCASLGRGSEVTSSATATTTKVVGMSFNGTARIIDTDTNAGGRQATVTYYYGPLVNSVTPTFGRIRGGTTITILGAGFQDPYFMQPAFGALNPQVRFTQSTGGSGVWFINSTTYSDTAVEASTLDYIHKCGDNDVIALQFYTNSSLTDRFVIPTDNRLTHHYGPLVTSITPTWGYVRGGDTVTITATQLDEWNGRKVRVLFANRESNNGDTEFVASAASTYTAVTPRGSFLHSGPVSLILDYKNDALTTANYWWHWHPYTSSVSQAWGIEGGGFQTTVYGGGFCEYELVTCNFGSTLGKQSDVAYDDRIVCQVPTAAPGTNTISLTFCDYWADCQASYAGSADSVAAFGFTHVGVTGVTPVSGPWVGNTLVTITGTGFDQFTSISVAFGSLAPVNVPVGNGTSATQLLVMTPASPNAQTVQIFLTMTYTFSDGATQTFTIPDRSSTPFNFRYEYPVITDISPAATDVDVTVPVTFTGLYFNGGVLSNIKCYWTVPTKTGTTTLTVDPTAKTDTTLTCSAPSVANGVVLLGPATVAVSWDGTRRSNIVVFTYTQTAAVTGITPTQGPQYGATRVTVFGNNFNTGISVLCRFGDQISASVDIVISSTTSTTGSTTGSANTTTTSTTATTGAANTTTTTSTTGATNTTGNSTAPVAARYGGREVRGTADSIVCLSPRSLSNSFPATARVEISLNGGLTWTETTSGVNSFTYQEGFTSTSESATVNSTSNSNVLVPLISMVFALVIFVVVF